MPTITRPIKTGGTTRYTDEVAAGFTAAKATEVDADLDLAYQTVNALDNTNIAPGAAIDYTKLSIPDASIPSNKLISVDGSKLVNASVVGSQKLATASVPTVKLAVGATVPALAVGTVVPNLAVLDNTETTLCTLGPLTTRGSMVSIYLAMSVRLYLDHNAPTSTFTLRVKRGAVTIETLVFGPLAVISGLSSHAFLPGMALVDAPGAGTFVYTVTGQLSLVAFGGFWTPAAGTGRVRAFEHA